MSVKTDMYNTNETMRIIGEQDARIAMDAAFKLRDIANAHGYKGTPDAFYDAFLLGVIYGKRVERARRRNKPLPVGGDFTNQIHRLIDMVENKTTLKFVHKLLTRSFQEEKGQAAEL